MILWLYRPFPALADDLVLSVVCCLYGLHLAHLLQCVFYTGRSPLMLAHPQTAFASIEFVLNCSDGALTRNILAGHDFKKRNFTDAAVNFHFSGKIIARVRIFRQWLVFHLVLHFIPKNEDASGPFWFWWNLRVLFKRLISLPFPPTGSAIFSGQLLDVPILSSKRNGRTDYSIFLQLRSPIFSMWRILMTYTT